MRSHLCDGLVAHVGNVPQQLLHSTSSVKVLHLANYYYYVANGALSERLFMLR